MSYLDVVPSGSDLRKAKFMPTVLRDGPYSFVFFSSDRGEPVHIHVKRERRVVKFWLDSIATGSLSQNSMTLNDWCVSTHKL